MRSRPGLCIAIASTLLTSCSASMPPSPEAGRNQALVELACPPLTPLGADASFGGTTRKLLEVAQQYHECRAAALGR